MQVATVYKVRQTLGGEKEDGVLQSLAIFEYIALDNARGANLEERRPSQRS